MKRFEDTKEKKKKKLMIYLLHLKIDFSIRA